MKKILVATAVAAAVGCAGMANAAEDITVDVAVIGAGGAGLSAAVEAANLGAKVVVVEKMAMPAATRSAPPAASTPRARPCSRPRARRTPLKSPSSTR